MIKNERHEFAFYWQNLSDHLMKYKLGQEFSITQKDLIHRMLRVLRINIGDTFFLFDQENHLYAKLNKILKNSAELLILNISANAQYSPATIVLLPVLKREALYESIYSCVELGAQEIWLIDTHKSQRLRNIDHDMKRLNNISIAAAEQSKHFAFPDIQAPQTLSDALTLFDYNKTGAIFFDHQGQLLIKTIEQLQKKEYASIVIAIGPEGDLMMEEKEVIKKYPFIFTKLTPTILRAQQALALGLGIIRSISF